MIGTLTIIYRYLTDVRTWLAAVVNNLYQRSRRAPPPALRWSSIPLRASLQSIYATICRDARGIWNFLHSLCQQKPRLQVHLTQHPIMALLDDVRQVILEPRTIASTAAVLATVWLLHFLLRRDAERAVEFTVPTPEQCKPDWQGKVLAEPAIKVSGSTAIQCYAPATGQLLGIVNPVTPDGIDRLVAKATAAQAEWAKTTFAQRRRVLKTLLKFVLDKQDELVRAACLDSGKTRVDALFGEVLVTVEKLKWTIDHGEKALSAEQRPRNLLMFYKQNEVRYEPSGVVAACVSWK